MTKRVVVTGGAGFIGSHLAGELAGNGYHVVVYDDLSTGKRSNLEPLLGDKKVSFVLGTVTDLALLQELFRGVEYVFHLAAIPSVLDSIASPQECHNVNLTGTLNVLLAARDNGVKKVIYASSSSVYGDTPQLPKREDMTPDPRSPYAVAKLAGEYYCRVFQEVYQLPTVSLRYFNVYGPRQDPEAEYAAVIPRFIKGMSEGVPPVIFGDGEQTRDFIFIKDAVAANILAAQSDAGGVFNISYGESITINRLADMLMGLTGSRLAPVHQEPKVGDIRHSLADIAKSRTFGYEPRYSLASGLAETVRWFKGVSR